MPSHRPLPFREQVEGALSGLAATAAYLLSQVAGSTEVRTEGDRALVVVCTIGAIVLGAALVVLLVRAGMRRRRRRAAEAHGTGAGGPVAGGRDDAPAAAPTRSGGDGDPAWATRLRPAAGPRGRPRAARRGRRRRGGPRRP